MNNPLYWTDEKPKKFGYYWYRLTPLFQPQIVKFHGNYVYGNGIYGRLSDFAGQWSDTPIPQPE